MEARLDLPVVHCLSEPEPDFSSLSGSLSHMSESFVKDPFTGEEPARIANKQLYKLFTMAEGVLQLVCVSI